MAVALDACHAGIDDVADARHGQRGLGDVGGQDHAPALMRREHARLLLRRLAREQRQDFQTGRMVFPQRLRRFAYLTLAGQKDQRVT